MQRNDLEKIRRLYPAAEFKHGMAYEFTVKHDDSCPMLKDGMGCKCDPEIEVLEFKQ